MAASPAAQEPAIPAARPATGRTKALLILNRNARHGRAGAAGALDRLRAAGFDLVEEPVEHPTEVPQFIRRNRDQVDAVIVGGGDGTLTTAVDGLVDAGLPLGIIPLGTANDLAHTLGLPTDPVAAADVIAAGHRKPIDLGWVNGTHFFNVASVGMSSAITRRLSRRAKSRWGVLAYLFAAARVAYHARPFTADIVTATETIRVHTVQVTVGNGRYYGGGLTVDEAATIDDGVLHLFSLEIERWWQIVPLLPSLRRGTLTGAPHVRTLRGGAFEVRATKKRKHVVTADGEVAGRVPAHFRIVPRALSVYVPGQ
ncbi:MAG TPA: lipid kinase [Gemmataceae bacterium]|nr:lipid kinase [Gemmataceae bacterium]